MSDIHRPLGHSTVWSILILLVVSMPARSVGADAAMKQGDAVDLSGSRCTLIRLDSLPFVENEYTRRFRFDSFDNPKLKELREHYRLDEVVAPGRDEFDRQVLLLDWVNHQFKRFGRPTSPARGAFDILEANEAGNTFFCAHYADVLVSAAASLGWVDRSLALRRPDSMGQGSTEHSSTEIWSNQHRKWMLFDPTFALYVEKDGVPLSAYEFRQEWFYHDARDVVFVMDKDRKRYKKSDMPVFRRHYDGFGDLVFDGGATNVYAFIGYVPNTNLMTAGPDYGKMFIVQDKICDGTRWHQRDIPADPAHTAYFPIDQSSLALMPAADHLRVEVKTMTPNFKTYLRRIDGGEWKPTSAPFDWTPPAGDHRLEVKSVNRFEVEGPISTADVHVESK